MSRIVAVLLFAVAAAVLAEWVRPRVARRTERLNWSAVSHRWFTTLLPSISRQRANERHQRLDIELVDALGEMVMGIEAGLSFESVLDIYSQRRRTPLGSEFRTILDDIRVGSSRVGALEAFERRIPTPTVRLFVSAVQQNHKLGAPLATSLRGQAAAARRHRRQNVEERSAKIALKMVFPTIFCILPVLMVVIVGPAIIRLIESLPK